MNARAGTALLLLFAAAGVPACSDEAPEEVATEAVVPVETAAAVVGDIQAAVRATGLVTPAPGAELLVVAPEPARIAELPKAEGDRVAKGDLLVRFEVPSTSAEVARQQADIARAEAQIANARATQTRARDLFERGVAARKEVEDADRDAADADAALAQARAGLAAAQVAADRVTVRAPFAGIVARRLHNPGDVVEAATSDPVLRLVDPARLEVVASLAVGDVGRVAPGAHARLVSPDGFALRLVSHPAAVDPATGAVPVRLAFSRPPETLAVGTPVQVSIEAETRQGVVLVPVAAVVREGQDTFVFVVTGDKAVRTPVTLGVSDGARVEIASGVTAGDRVIVSGQAGLPDGAAVTVGAPTP
ncbi:MAG: efflux RND transporter periplasmic adaptor subunit [Vicinamibacterales bacterium]